MTNEEINIAIAEACGWTTPPDCANIPKHGWWNPDDNSCYNHPPDYCNDWNAMRGAVDSLPEQQRMEFIHHLDLITLRRSSEWFPVRFITSTLREWAVAFLRTVKYERYEAQRKLEQMKDEWSKLLDHRNESIDELMVGQAKLLKELVSYQERVRVLEELLRQTRLYHLGTPNGIPNAWFIRRDLALSATQDPESVGTAIAAECRKRMQEAERNGEK